jgi:hypothetical protein
MRYPAIKENICFKLCSSPSKFYSYLWAALLRGAQVHFNKVGIPYKALDEGRVFDCKTDVVVCSRVYGMALAYSLNEAHVVKRCERVGAATAGMRMGLPPNLLPTSKDTELRSVVPRSIAELTSTSLSAGEQEECGKGNHFSAGEAKLYITRPPTHEALQGRYGPWGRREAAPLFREVGDSAETAYHSDMYATSEMASRWKEIHWWQIDKRCWEATYGPNTQGSAHLREAKDGDGEPWPEWTGEQPCDHHDNGARETARKELERDLITPDFTEIVGAAVAGHLISIATETIMSHLSNYIFLTELCSRAHKQQIDCIAA